MASLESLDIDSVAHITFRGSVGPVGEVCKAIETACAAGAELTLILLIEVEKDITLEDTRLESDGSGHAGLLIVSDEHLQRAMPEGLVLKD